MTEQNTIMEKKEENESSTTGRQKLINTAVEFLNMDRILSQPESMKREFLEKKGLTKEEIEIAFQESQIQKPTRSEIGIPAHSPGPHNQLVFVPPNALPVIPTFWTKLRNGVNMVIFLSGMAFGINYFYKYYVRPFLTGQKPKSEEDTLLDVQRSVRFILQDIESMLERINENILNSNQKNLEVQREAANMVNSSSVQDLKVELNTIKSLLINKKSFPSAPSSYPSIPEWQKRNQLQIEDSQERGNTYDENVNGENIVTNSEDFVEEDKCQGKEEAE